MSFGGRGCLPPGCSRCSPQRDWSRACSPRSTACSQASFWMSKTDPLPQAALAGEGISVLRRKKDPTAAVLVVSSSDSPLALWVDRSTEIGCAEDPIRAIVNDHRPAKLGTVAPPVSTWQEYRRELDSWFAFMLQVRPGTSEAPWQL